MSNRPLDRTLLYPMHVKNKQSKKYPLNYFFLNVKNFKNASCYAKKRQQGRRTLPRPTPQPVQGEPNPTYPPSL